MRTRIAILVAIGLSAALSWWLVVNHAHTEAATRPVAYDPPAAAPPKPETPIAATTQPIKPVPFSASRADADAGALASRDPAQAILRGRCVDAATKQPLAGCRVSLQGSPGSSQRMADQVTYNGRVAWTDPAPLTTGADGRFEFAVVPPSPFQFVLLFTAPDRVWVLGRWTSVAPGSDIDAGDVPMAHGTRVTGRVIDADGSPVGGIEVHLMGAGPRPTPLAQRTSFQTTSSADGGLEFREPLPAMSFTVSVVGRANLVEPAKFALAEAEPEHELLVKVNAIQGGDTLSGIVVDDLGQPVARADVQYSPWGDGMHRMISSGKDGSFEIVRGKQSPADLVTVSVTKSGFETASTKEPVPWGSRDLRLVMRRGLSVDITVRDGETGRPIEEYGVKCFPVAGAGSREPPRIRDEGVHPGGRLHLDRVVRGTQRLEVYPTGKGYGVSPCVEFEVADPGVAPLEIIVWPSVTKTVRVRRADGSPVVGTHIDLLRRIGDATVDESTFTNEGPVVVYGWVGTVQVLDRGVTGSEGTLDVTGPIRQPVVLPVLGPGHPPLVREVALDRSDAYLDIVVPAGAALQGRITPKAFLDQTRSGSEVASRRTRDGRRTPGTETGLFLSRGGAHGARCPLGDAVQEIADDGSFRLEGIAPGQWTVCVGYVEAMKIERATSSRKGFHVLGTVDLVAGEDREVNYDLSVLLKATIVGKVTVDGAVLAGGTVSLNGRGVSSVGERPRVSKPWIFTDSDGTFEVQIWPGDYRLEAQSKDAGFLRDREVWHVVAGQRIERVFALQSSVVRVRVLASDGVSPVAGVVLLTSLPDDESPQASRPTDVEGRTEIRGLPAGACVIQVTPRAGPTEPLTDERARPAPARRVEVATVTVTPPVNEVSITLPASAGF